MGRFVTVFSTFPLLVFLSSANLGTAYRCSYEGINATCSDVLNVVFKGSTVKCSDQEELCSVRVTGGNHFISGVVYLEDIDLFLIGDGDDAKVVCQYNNSKKEFSFLFAHNQRVFLQNLHFRNCIRPISVIGVQIFEVHTSTFRFFSEAVFDIFNCQRVNISDCVFEHNRGSGRSTASNRGNTGCLSIGYHHVNSSFKNLIVEITDSLFVNNTASVDSNSPFINLVGANVYRGRGGALGMFFDNVDVTASVTNCEFRNNKALYGAGLYIAYNGPAGQIYHKAVIRNCSFVDNKAKFGGGGMLAAFLVFGDFNNPMIAEVIKTDFVRNQAGEVGGGLAFSIADRNTIEGVKGILNGCAFVGNKAEEFGSAIRFSVFNTIVDSEKSNIYTNHEMVDCTFRENSGRHGTLSVAHVPLKLSGTVLFENNIGQSLQLIGSKVTVEGEIQFIGNDARRDGGGALYISSFGQILMKYNSKIVFANNTGRTGSAIVVDTQRTSSTFSNILFNPYCFLLFEDVHEAPAKWTNVTIIFKNNSASVGADVFAGSLESCSWYSFRNPFFNIKQFQNWSIFQNTATSIQTDPAEVTLDIKQLQEWPQEHIKGPETQFTPGLLTTLNPTLKDQFGKGTVGTIQLIHSPESDMSVDIQSEPSVLVVTSEKSVNVTFSLRSEVNLEEDDLYNITGALEVTDLARNGLTSMNIKMSTCPPGQSLQLQLPNTGVNIYQCGCNNANQFHIVLCDNNRNRVILQLGYWSVYADSILHGYSCPPGYCRCHDASSFSNRACYPSYSISDPGTQCVCGRQGILCGKCVNSTGVTSLYLHCEDCHPAVGTTFIVAVLLGAAVVGVIVFFNIQLPTWMIPILFYIRMASYYGYYFPPTFELVGKYLYFLSSLLSLYFPYDFCIPGTNALGVFAARFMPLFVTTVVWPFAWILNKKRNKGVYHWKGSVTIAFLVFSHTFHTALQILNCPLVNSENGDLTPTLRWYHNGEERCFRGLHAPLAVVALLVLVAFIALCIVLAAAISNKLKSRWLRKLRDVFEKYFKENLISWTFIEVARRVVLIMILVIFPRSTIAPLIALAVFICAYGYCKPFKEQFTNYLDLFLLASLSLLIALPGNQLMIENLFHLVDHMPMGNCSRTELAGVTKLSLVLLPFYYLPLLVSATAVVSYLTMKWCRGHQKKTVQPQLQEAVTRRVGGNETDQLQHTVTVELSVYNEDADLQ